MCARRRRPPSRCSNPSAMSAGARIPAMPGCAAGPWRGTTATSCCRRPGAVGAAAAAADSGWEEARRARSMALTLYPAIDLKGGQVVRLKRGDMAQATVYSGEPADQARTFAAQGFSWLHVVDLDGAFAGRPANAAAVETILAAVPGVPVQLGGGIRDMRTVDAWLARGVRRAILGSAALKNPEFTRAACAKHPGRIAVGIDARQGMVAVEGWAEASTMTAVDLARRFEDAGAALAGAALLALRLDDRITRTEAFGCFALLGTLPWLGTKFVPAGIVVAIFAVRSLLRAKRRTLALGSVELAAFSV